MFDSDNDQPTSGRPANSSKPVPAAGQLDQNATPAEQEAERKLADLHLVDALLANLTDQSNDRRERRIQRVMGALAPVSKKKAGRPAIRWLTFATAAAILLALLTLVSIQWNNESLANELLSEISKASSSPTDRVYTVSRIPPGGKLADLPSGTLYLRGRKGLVLTWGDVVLGRCHDAFWLVESDRQHVTTAGSFDWIDRQSTQDPQSTAVFQELSLQSRHVPLMELASVSELIQLDYDVQLSRSSQNGRPVDVVVGQRRSSLGDLPEWIYLHADPLSHVITYAKLIWPSDNAIVLVQAQAGSIDADWYHYQSHCEAEPIVRQAD